MLRPQVKRISVAIMGWILKNDTSEPLNAPKAMATAQQARNAPSTVRMVMSPPLRTFTKTLPAMAARAPTEISCPPEAAVTSVMPMERMTSSDAPLRIEMRLPCSTGSPLLLVDRPTEKKPGSRNRLKITSSKMAIRGIKS